MPLNVLILHPDPRAAQPLTDFFTQRGDQVQWVANPAEVISPQGQTCPDLVVMNLHQDDWKSLLARVRTCAPHAKLLLTSNYPDLPRELEAKELGARVFLRKPFTPFWIERALERLEQESTTPPSSMTAIQKVLHKVDLPIRAKLTLPYALLALILALAAAYVVSRIALESVEERFTRQLIDVGKVTADWMVQQENRQLETLRLLANLQGLPEAVVAGDAERLREMALPIAVNYQEKAVEAIEILDTTGKSVLSLRHRRGGNIEDFAASRGDTIYREWDFVQSVLNKQTDRSGDKYAGLARAPWGDYFCVAGPILNDANQPVGVLIVGRSLPTLVRQIRQDVMANVTLYDFDGKPLASTFISLTPEQHALSSNQVVAILDNPAGSSLVRTLSVGSSNYSEILGLWQARRYTNLGLFGASLLQTFLVQPSQATLVQVFILVTVAFLLIIGIGVYLANRITRPLLQVVAASGKVAQGDLDVKVNPVGSDEVAILSQAFNLMVSRLREGAIYRDLLGRTVSPEVREQLRQHIASGDLRLEGQEEIATVLFADVRGFTTVSEEEKPTTVLVWLNEYFSQLVPIIMAHGGVVNKFDGDAVLAFFGILPNPLSPQDSAYRACQTAQEMLLAIQRFNEERHERGAPRLETGISINTGPVTAGGLGAADRLHYTIIGDTVNAAHRLQSITREFGESGIVISHHTLFALRERHKEFCLEPLGPQMLRGKVEQLLAYRLRPQPVASPSPES